MSSRLHHEIIAPAEAGDAMRRELYALFARCYDCVSRSQFDLDLAEKDSLILLRTAEGRICGFSTQQVFEMMFEGEAVRILFSGDTIIEPAFWGSAELIKGWCRVAARALQQQPETPLFWFLISKGYRTYLYLPLFFREYLPSPAGSAPSCWQRLLDQAARRKFGEAYDPESQLIRFARPQGQLSEALAQIPPARQGDPHVRFFMEKNPHFAQGVELACLTEVTLANTHGLGQRWLGQALRQAMNLEPELA
jgi:hypothetical protein